MSNPLSKLITGPLDHSIKWASDWGYQGFIGYACNRYVVVVDPKTLQVIQTVGPHSSSVTHVRWAREKYHHAFATGRTYSLILAAADNGGNILIWDVVTGHIRTEFQRPPIHVRFLELEWVPGHDESHDLLLVLRFPGQLEMWDAYAGVQLWKTEFGENLLSFALDPFNINRLICLSEVTHLVLVSDLDPTKQPKGDRFKYIWYSDPNPVINSQSSLKRQSSGEKSPRRTTSASSWSRMANLATNMILTGSSSDSLIKRWSISEDDSDTLSSCLQVVFSPVHNHVVLLVFSSDIVFIDIDVELVVGTVRFDQSSPFIMKVIPCVSSDMLFCLHDNGSSSLMVRRQKKTDKDKTDALNMRYETVSLSDSMRLSRQVKMVGFSKHPVTETQVAIHLSDSKIMFLDVMATSFHKTTPTVELCNPTLGEMVNSLKVVLPGRRTKDNPEEIIIRLVVSGLVSGLNYPVTCISMRPSRATLNEVGQHLAVGSGCGSIQLVNVYSGQVEHEYKLFSNPVRGMEWMRASRIITYTYTDPSSYGNRGVRNEVVVLDTNTGDVDIVRGNVGNEGPIQLLKASPSGKYMAVAVKDKPLEIWNIHTKQLLKKLTDLLHKPNHLAWHPSVAVIAAKNKETRSVIVEQLFISIIYDVGCLMRVPIQDGIVSDMVFFTNEMVFGQNAGKTDIQTLTWKGNYLVMADRAGQLYFKHTQSAARKIHEKHGMTPKCIRFSPGKQNFKFLVLYDQTVDIWEISDKNKVEYITSSPSLKSPLVDATWTGPESVAIVTEDVCLHVMRITTKSPSSPVKVPEDDFIHVHERTMKMSGLPMQNWKISDVFSPALMDRKTAFLLKYSLQCNIEPFNDTVQPLLGLISSEAANGIRECRYTADRCLLVARLFGDEYDMEFWQMFKYVSKWEQTDTCCMSDLEKPLNLTDWISKLLKPPSEVNDLLDLSTNDLDISTNDLDKTSQTIDRTANELDSSWVNALVEEEEPFVVFSLGLLMNHDDYKSYEASRLLLHNKMADKYRVKKVCASRFIMMDKITMATQVLMETDTDNLDFRHDCLKACLTSCVQPSSESIGTLKLAATHLIAAGHLQDGVDLLCLINKQSDACKYMITYGHWLDAVWLAKISLSEKERLSLVCKFADHLWQGSQKMKAILVMMSVGQFTTVLRMLFSLGQHDTAALFLQACVEHGLLSNTQATDQVNLEFAKFLIVTQYQAAVEHYCTHAGDIGHSLLKDIQSIDKTTQLL